MKNWIVMYGRKRLLRTAGQQSSAMSQTFDELEDANAFVRRCKVDGLYAVLQPTPAIKAIIDGRSA
jgi:hypothetical protein